MLQQRVKTSKIYKALRASSPSISIKTIPSSLLIMCNLFPSTLSVSLTGGEPEPIVLA